ncbi:g11599 [Coccomyxa elongata]
MGDFLDACLDLESQHIQEGHEQGKRDGMVAGYQEGKELGEQKGLEIGSEVGMYAGFCEALRELQQQQPALLERVEKQLATMEDIARKFPLDNPKDERMQDMMLDLRGKFKAIRAKLGLSETLQFASATEQRVVTPSLDF